MPIDALSVLFAQLTRDLLAIAKFLFTATPYASSIFTSFRQQRVRYCYRSYGSLTLYLSLAMSVHAAAAKIAANNWQTDNFVVTLQLLSVATRLM